MQKLSADPKTAWRVTKDDWRRFNHYDEFITVCEQALRETSTGEAPWRVIEGADAAYRSLTAGNLLPDALRRRLDGPAPVISPAAPPPEPAIDRRDVLNTPTTAPRSPARPTTASWRPRRGASTGSRATSGCATARSWWCSRV